MTICLLDAAPVTFADKLAYGGRMMLIGMGIVFSVLVILWGSLELMRLFCYTLPNRKRACAPPPADRADDTAAVTAAADQDEEIVAVLAAAVAAAEAEAPRSRFKAVSFKRIN